MRFVCLPLRASPPGAAFLTTLLPVTPFWSLSLEQGSSPSRPSEQPQSLSPGPPRSGVSCQKWPLGKWHRASEHRLRVPLRALPNVFIPTDSDGEARGLAQPLRAA